MLSLEAKLNPKAFDKDIEMKPTRDGYGDGLVLAADHNKNVVALCADLTESTRAEAFAKKYPERFFECGVAEQNMATIAAGLGISGKIPFISSYATFSPGRNYEQIRTTIAYNDSNVKIAGHHAGVSVGPDGATHQATEDIAIMRAMPNMKVFVPCDAIEARKITEAAAKIWGPVYIRFGREKSTVLTTEATPFTPGKAEVFWQSKKPEVLIIACGILVHNALLAARDLSSGGGSPPEADGPRAHASGGEKEKIGVVVLNNHSIKPIDEEAIVSWAKKCGAVVTVEEHQVSGGLGSAVAEILARRAPTPIEFIGMQDTFGESGPPAELIDKYGMGVKDIKAAIKKVLKRR